MYLTGQNPNNFLIDGIAFVWFLVKHKEISIFLTACLSLFSSCVHGEYNFEMVWEEASPLYHKILEQPFIMEMVEGFLPYEKYHNYIEQDVLYLLYESDAFKITAQRAPNEIQRNYLLRIHAGIERTLANYLREYRIEINEIIPVCECQVYREHVIQAAYSQSYFYNIGVLIPCVISYSFIANHFINKIESTNPYNHWFTEFYQKLGRTIGNAKKFIDNVLQNANEADYSNFLMGFKESMQMEILFWEGMHN